MENDFIAEQTFVTPFIHKVGLTSQPPYCEKLGALWFLTAGFNHILKTDNISKTSQENPQTTVMCCRKQLFS